MGPVRLGVDIGGTNVKLGLVDSRNRLAAFRSVPTCAERGAEAVIKEIGRQAKALLREQGAEECLGAGLGVPGTVDRERGVVLYSNNLRWEDVPLIELLGRVLSMPLAAANDADCAALGETVAGAGRGCRNVVMLTLGTGVGGGVVLNGEILSGSEPGHMVIVEGGEPCTCGRRGCLEAYASAAALKREAERASGRALEPEGVFAAAAVGDPALREVADGYIRRLGLGVVNVINLFRPQLLLLGGGVSQQGETLLAPLREMARRECFGGKKVPLPEIRIAALGNRAGVIGAASLIRPED